MLVSRVLKASSPEHAKRIAFWMLQPKDDESNGVEIKHKASDQHLIKLSQMVSNKQLSSTAAKEILSEMMRSGTDPEVIAVNLNLLQESNEDKIFEIVAQVLSENDKAANDVRSGETKAIGFLVGQVMKLSQGKANPALATDLIKKQLGM